MFIQDLVDKLLLKLISKGGEAGWVELATVAAFKRVRALTREGAPRVARAPDRPRPLRRPLRRPRTTAWLVSSSTRRSP